MLDVDHGEILLTSRVVAYYYTCNYFRSVGMINESVSVESQILDR